MKTIIIPIAAAFLLHFSAGAEDVSVKISEVHLCCKGCVTGAEKAISTVPGAKAEVDQAGGTVTLTAPDSATAQKGATALLKAGYFGKSSDSHVRMDALTGAKGAQVKSVHVEGVHLCCAKCVKAVD